MQISRVNRWLVGTLLALGAGFALVLWQVRPTYDLAFFLPEPVTEQEQVLVERLGQGAGARLIFIEIAAPPGADAAEQSALLAERLAPSPLFLRVENGQREIATDSIPEPIWRWRYLLTDTDWSERGIRQALEERVGDLASIGGPEVSMLIARDPLWAAPRVLERLQFGGAGTGSPSTGPRWSDGPGHAFLIAETAAAPFDIASQQQAVEAIRRAFREVTGREVTGREATGGEATGGEAGLELYGVGVYSARVQELIQSEAQLLGLLATVVVLAIVALAYRSLRLMLISMIPLASAVLGGLAASSLVFGSIHGITVAFGATLVGVVDDYPMHLFSHARHVAPRDGVRLLLRTLLASAGTAIVAYASLVVSGSRGLAQLGVFSLTGILCAIVVTCWVLPNLMQGAGAEADHDATPQEFALSPRLWLPLLVAAIVAISATGGIRWNDNLGELTPLPASVLARDQAMRQRFGAPDVRYLVSITADSAESVLVRTEALEAQLAGARAEGLIDAWSGVTTLLPGAAAQERRRAAIPPAEVLEERLAAASTGLPFRPDAFAPFLADAATSRHLAPLRAGDLAGGFAGDYVSNHLTRAGDQWRSVVFLTGLGAPEKMATWLQGQNLGAELVDLKTASESLVRGYRLRLMTILLGALALIAVLVVWSTRSVGRVMWSAGTVAASVLFTLAVVNWLHGSVSLFHLVSLVLVAGLGVDYCLFYSRPGVSQTDFRDTGHAVIAGAASTGGAFTILATSSIPLLSAIGTTVAIGTFSMFIVARAGCRSRAAGSRIRQAAN